MKRDGPDIDRVLRHGLAPASRVQVEQAIERVYARLGSEGDATAHTQISDGRRELRPVLWFRPAVTLATSAAVIAAAIWIGVSMREEGIAVLEAADASLYRIAGGSRIPIHAGDRIAARETVRAGGDGVAVLSLSDGSKVEMRTQSELAMDRREGVLTIHLNSGTIIVNAATASSRQLYVRTKDVTVAADGAVSLVSVASEGSRVGAIQGEVRIGETPLERKLRPGEQVSTDPTRVPRPLQEEITWSPHRETYMRILEAFTRGMAQTAGPRTSLNQRAPRAAPAVSPERQTPVISSPPTFEEASVRLCDPSALPLPPPGGRGGGRGSFQMTPGRLHALCMTVATLIRTAYGLGSVNDVEALRLDVNKIYGLGNADGRQVRGGPDWVRSERYTIDAVANDAADPRAMSGPMLRDLLERRFRLAAHFESEPVSAFALTIPPGGLKMQPVAADACTPLPAPGDGAPPSVDRAVIDRVRRGEKPICGLAILPDGPNLSLVSGASTSRQLAGLLIDILGARVIDRTDVPSTAHFNFVLEFAPDERTAGPLGGRGRGGLQASDEPRASDIFTALKEQLGLALEPVQAPREYIVIDRIERPSPN